MYSRIIFLLQVLPTVKPLPKSEVSVWQGFPVKLSPADQFVGRGREGLAEKFLREVLLCPGRKAVRALAFVFPFVIQSLDDLVPRDFVRDLERDSSLSLGFVKIHKILNIFDG